MFFGYLAGLVLYFLSFELQSDSYYKPAKLIVLASILLHFGLLLFSFIENQGLAITTLAEYMGSASFLMILISFLIEWRTKTRFLLLFSLLCPSEAGIQRHFFEIVVIQVGRSTEKGTCP